MHLHFIRIALIAVCLFATLGFTISLSEDQSEIPSVSTSQGIPIVLTPWKAR